MSNTTNYNLTKPNEGSSGWANDLNSNFDTIDNVIKANETAVQSHLISNSAHNASSIKSNTIADNVQEALNILNSNKANANHTHNIYITSSELEPMQTEINTIKNTLDQLSPDLDLVELSASISNKAGGISVSINTTPYVHLTACRVMIAFNGSYIYDSVNSSSFVFVPENAINHIVNHNDNIQIKVIIYSGYSMKERTYTHQFKHIYSDFEIKVNSYMQTLTISAIVNAFAQDVDALQSLANVLHSSNTLAQKIALIQGGNQ
ncbi:MAG: hypothetical protein RBS16_01875 [Candidatus Cloacimonadales bacterium]|nr:hypothetical protein [Candidatus Cloacimonadota bacterium]MDX9976761.1 hypothetical protein [Candidatus Cloacimonadales bacterium]